MIVRVCRLTFAESLISKPFERGYHFRVSVTMRRPDPHRLKSANTDGRLPNPPARFLGYVSTPEAKSAIEEGSNTSVWRLIAQRGD
jgi:hypothetical protein